MTAKPRFRPGDRVRFNNDWLNTANDPVTVLSILDRGRVEVAYGRVTSLIVPAHYLIPEGLIA